MRYIDVMSGIVRVYLCALGGFNYPLNLAVQVYPLPGYITSAVDFTKVLPSLSPAGRCLKPPMFMWTYEANIAHIELIISGMNLLSTTMCFVLFFTLILWGDRLIFFKVLIHIEYNASVLVGKWLENKR